MDKQVYFDNGGVVAHNSYKDYIINSPQHHANLQASTFFNTGSIGHELKFGFQYRHSVTQSESAWPGDQIFGSDTTSSGSPHCGKNLDSCYAAVTRGAATSFQMNYTEAWVSDTFTVDRLTVNAGLRFDYQQGGNLPSWVGANPTFPTLLPAVTYTGDDGYPDHLPQLESPGRPDVRARRREEEPRPGVLRAVLRPAAQRRLPRQRSADHQRHLLLLERQEQRQDRPDERGGLRERIPGLLQHRSELRAEDSQPDRAGLQGADDGRVHHRLRPRADERLLRVRRLHVPLHHEHPAKPARRHDGQRLRRRRVRDGNRPWAPTASG